MAETKTAQPEKPLDPTFLFNTLKEKLKNEYANQQHDLSKVRDGFNWLREVSDGPLINNGNFPERSVALFLREVSDILIEELEGIRSNRETAHFIGGGAVPSEFTMLTDDQPDAVLEVKDLIQEIQQWQGRI